MADDDVMPTSEGLDNNQKMFKYKAGAFLAGITGLSLVGGFGMTLTFAKKQDPEMFTKGIDTAHKLKGVESGGSLALRALGRGTLYSVTGFSIFCYAIWKMMGVNNMTEFREKMGRSMPQIPKSEHPEGRTEFSGIRDLLEYIIDEDNKKHHKSTADNG